ncbi:NEP1-interacting protein 1-like [Asparagus officinalis]|uniref:NEP1-interacting protein 1-like n=1 Tax=Asparagus officinalis TaxID=4686 RepID=UPI00098E7006|nr:NEP1-interacting protein 1-like [Asparagus officinalis]
MLVEELDVSIDAEKIICAIVTCVFATVCSVVGAITGGVIGLATESGLFRGAGIGAISGAVFSIEVVESSLFREKVGPAVQSAVQSQMSAVDAPFIEVLDIFETGGTGGMSKDSVNKLEKSKISKQNNGDDFGEKICYLFAFRYHKEKSFKFRVSGCVRKQSKTGP